MKKEDKELLQMLADLRVQEKVISEKIKEVQSQLSGVIETLDPDTQIEVDGGSFTVVARRKWHYPKEVVEIEKQLKQEQKRAQQTGEAEEEIQNSLRFNVDK